MKTLKILSGNSQLVQEYGWQSGQFALIESLAADGAEPIGPMVRCRVLSMLPKAVDTNKEITSYFPFSRAFRDIQERSNIHDAGCVFGAEILLELIPTGHPSNTCGKEVLFFAGNNTLRCMLPHFSECVGFEVILTTVEIKQTSSGGTAWRFGSQ